MPDTDEVSEDGGSDFIRIGEILSSLEGLRRWGVIRHRMASWPFPPLPEVRMFKYRFDRYRASMSSASILILPLDHPRPPISLLNAKLELKSSITLKSRLLFLPLSILMESTVPVSPSILYKMTLFNIIT